MSTIIDYTPYAELLKDPWWRLNNLYYIQDKKGDVVKFVPNVSQKKLWFSFHYLNIILKDRQRGFSTLIAMIILDTCIFNKNQSCGIIDITLDDAMLKVAKIKFAYDRLPDDLRRECPLVTDSKGTLEWANNSSVQAGTSHRGGTLQILHISEFGKISARNPEKAREIRTGALNTLAPGQHVFIESTAEGRQGEFFEYCETARKLKDERKKLTKLDFKFFFFGWWMDGNENEISHEGVEIPPDKQKYFDELEGILGIKINKRKRAWYCKKSVQQKGDMLREFPATPEEAFDASIEGAYLAKILSGMRRDGKITRVPHEPESPVNTAWDFGVNDHMSIWLHQYVGLQHRLIGYMSGTDEDVLFYWQKLQQLGYTWGRHFLPHDANNRRIGSARSSLEKPKTLKVILEKAGMQNIKVVPRIGDKAVAIQESKLFLPKCYISTSCDKQPGWSKEEPEDYKGGLLCLQNFRRKWDDKLGTWKNVPVHDWAQHGYDSLETLARGFSKHGGVVPIRPENDYSNIGSIMNTYVC